MPFSERAERLTGLVVIVRIITRKLMDLQKGRDYYSGSVFSVSPW